MRALRVFLPFFFMALAAIAPAINIQPQVVASGFDEPIFVTHPNDGSGLLFVVQREGRIMIIDTDLSVRPAPFLDIGATGLNLIEEGFSEQGLLGLAFHPSYDTNGLFYVSYTRLADGANIVSRFSVSAGDPYIANTTETIIYGPITQPQVNHNGGMIAFGPDDLMYFGIGDGGSGGDTGTGHTPGIGNAQDRTNVLGDLVRIDVNNTSVLGNYSIPPTNPFVGNGNGWREEIYAWGLRNPWRFSFDRATGRLFCGDVGQDLWEEVDLIVSGGNYGWRRMEGFNCYNPSTGCQTGSLILPLVSYDHVTGCSVTGGYVYRGGDYPALDGLYFYGDYCSGRIWTLEETAPNTWVATQRYDASFNISSFGEGRDGELYVCDYWGGRVLEITDTDPQPTPTPSPNAVWSWEQYE